SKYMTGYIVTRDKYGDWCVPPEGPLLIHAKDSSRLTDGQLIATAYYHKMLAYLQRFAGLLNKKEDAKVFGLLMDSIRMAFNKKFYDVNKKLYSNNTATANLLPLYFGLVPDSLKLAIFDKIRQKILVENNGHTSTGLIGSQWLMRTLSDYGSTDVAYTLTTNTTYPSWGYMVANGATTIWELWNGNTANPGMNSQNHVMLLGDLLTWYYENLAGIRSDKTEVAFKKIIMKPGLPTDLEFVNASYNSFHGLIRSDWKKTAENFEWNVTIPANTSAVIHVPARSVSDVTESGRELSKTEGVQIVKWENGSAILQAGSGQYKFTSKIK
ncbi:MAG: alpha-L-rhamnosidase C-terminal domain-containing protein, partial [Chitinophagales bacterium]